MRFLLVLLAATCATFWIGLEAPDAGVPRSTLTAGSSSFGRILFDGRGYALYGFTRDPRRKSACTGSCAKAWPPYLVTSRAHAQAGSGVRSRLIGTTTRADGRLQVTYAGHPLYYYVGDRKPGDVNGQGLNQFGAEWYALSPAGRKIDNG
jgi:predicted lipoprotein with Yx(FWY)xxD motif